LDKKLDVKQADRYGWTPLHYAAFKGRKEAVELLVNRGAEVNKRNLAGKTPFNMAAEGKFTEITQFLLSKDADSSPQKFPVLKGKYLGQKRPGPKPEVFAKGIVSTQFGEHGSLTISPDGKEIYWGVMLESQGSGGTIAVLTAKMEGETWTPPRMASFSKGFEIKNDVPFISPDGRRLFFHSSRPIRPGSKEVKENVWIVDKTPGGWAEPKALGEAVNRMNLRWQSTVSRKGTLYFASTESDGLGGSDIYLSRFEEGKYAKPVNLGAPVSSSLIESGPFIAPDESYIIFDRQGEGLVISYRDKEGKWTKPKNLGPAINYRGAQAPYVSPDGKYLFFNSGRNRNYDIYWADASFIEEWRPAE
jgi:hypothetical protein